MEDNLKYKFISCCKRLEPNLAKNKNKNINNVKNSCSFKNKQQKKTQFFIPEFIDHIRQKEINVVKFFCFFLFNIF